jgi:hypothetical protein
VHATVFKTPEEIAVLRAPPPEEDDAERETIA